MFKLQQKKVIETQPIAVSATNYSKEQINSLFELKWYQPVWRYNSKSQRLFDLGLSFDDSKYLLQTKKLNVDEIVKCISDFRLDVDLIRKLTCTKDTLLDEIPNIITMVGGVEHLRILISKELSIENIKTLFSELRLSYIDTVSLINCGYETYEIKTLLEGEIACSDLVALARIIDASKVYSIFREDRQNLVLLLSVRKILNKKISDLNSALECYHILYDYIPNNLCKSLIDCSTKFYPSRPETDDANVGYEEILKHYMDLAGGNIPMVIGVADAIPEIFILLEKIIGFEKPSYLEFIDDYIPVKPFILAAIWCALDMSLENQYLKNAENINSEVVGRSILSFLVSSMCGVTGFFHSGGIPNITSYIRTCFNIQHLIKNYAPDIYTKIPRYLLFDTNEAFENLIKEKQIDAGRGLSMVYTFRVGNSFLCSLLGTHIFTFETIKNIFKSLWPLPQEMESIRMYFIYSGIPIYSKLNLKDVFVSIP